MLSSTARPHIIRATARRWHSSSSWPPQTKDPNGNDSSNSSSSNNNNEVDASQESKTVEDGSVQLKADMQIHSTSKSAKLPAERKSASRSLKKPISVKPHSSAVVNPPSTHVVTPPSVNSTQHLDQAMIRNDIFYGGYRPVLTPLRRPVTKTKRTPTVPLSWNTSACKLETFDDYSKVPQFVVDKLTPFAVPQSPGSEIRIGAKSRKEQKEMERLSKDVYELIKHFRK